MQKPFLLFDCTKTDGDLDLVPQAVVRQNLVMAFFWQFLGRDKLRCNSNPVSPSLKMTQVLLASVLCLKLVEHCPGWWHLEAEPRGPPKRDRQLKQVRFRVTQSRIHQDHQHENEVLFHLD